MAKPKLAVGMTVWVVYSRRHGDGVERTITKIGRKWAYTDLRNQRFDINSWCIDGGDYVSTGEVYASEQAFKDHLALQKEWQSFHGIVRQLSWSNVPGGMTLEKIQQIKALLGMAE